MNVIKVKSLIKELEGKPVEALAKKDIDALGVTLTKFIDKIDKVEAAGEVSSFFSNIPPGSVKFFDALLKQKKIQRPRNTQAASEQRSQLTKIQKEWNNAQKNLRQLMHLLEELKAKSPEWGAERLTKVTPNQKKELSLLAGLTKRTPNGIAPFSIAASQAANLKWLEELNSSKLQTILYN